MPAVLLHGIVTGKEIEKYFWTTQKKSVELLQSELLLCRATNASCSKYVESELLYGIKSQHK